MLKMVSLRERRVRLIENASKELNFGSEVISGESESLQRKARPPPETGVVSNLDERLKTLEEDRGLEKSWKPAGVISES